VRVRGRAWKVYDKPAGDFREFSGWRPFTANGYDSARVSADALAAHWPRMGNGAPPRDSEAARRTPLASDEERAGANAPEHNRRMRAGARARQHAAAPRRRTRRAA
jgi:hypothetical protein